jgi:hypothetical protein
MIVGARQKPVDQLPEWALCCEATRQLHVEEEALGSIVRIDTSTIFVAEAECKHCHRIIRNLKYVPVIGTFGARVIAVDLHDFDEGQTL